MTDDEPPKFLEGATFHITIKPVAHDMPKLPRRLHFRTTTATGRFWMAPELYEQYRVARARARRNQRRRIFYFLLARKWLANIHNN